MNTFYFRLTFCSLIIVSILLGACHSSSEKNERSVDNGGIILFDAAKSINQKPVRTNLSQIADSCAYVFLETDRDCLIDRIRQLYLTEQYIITITRKECLVFNRNTGKFIRKIGQYGEGPNDILGIAHTALDADRDILYVLSWNKRLLRFNINDGNLLNVVPKFNDGKNDILYFDLIDSVNYIGNVHNEIGNAKYRFISGTVYGDVIYSFPNYSFFTIKEYYDPDRNVTTVSVSTLNMDTQFYRFKNNLYLKEYLNDTLFFVKDAYTLLPRLIFDIDQHHFPLEIRNDVEKIGREVENYIMPENIFETDDYLFFQLSYKHKNYEIAYSKKDRLFSLIDVKEEKYPFYGFINDIEEEFPPFWPKYASNSGEMVSWYLPDDLKLFFEEREAPIASEELKNKINNLTEDDNPVIAIVK